jgi:hypothetical protein
MMTEIYIEGRRLDLTQDISAEFTYQIDDIKDFASRNTNFSKTIVLPGSARNNKQFGYVFEFGSANFFDEASGNVGYNFNAAKQAQCTVYVDKVQIMKGGLRLLEIVRYGDVVEYECAIFGELGGFVNAVANSKIENLDFSSYDHAWNLTNITQSWDNMAASGVMPGSGYFYPLIDYGKVSYNNKHDWDVRAFRPAVYVREVVDKIITNAGYTWESDFFNTPLFKRLIIPNNDRELYKTSSTPLSASVSTTKTVLTSAGTAINLLNYDSAVLNGMTANPNKNTFTYTGATTISVSATLNGYGYLQSYQNVFIRVLKNDVAITESVQAGIGAISRPYFFSLPFTTTLATNDTIKIQFQTQVSSNPTFLVTAMTGNLIIESSAVQAIPADYGDNISMNANLPKGIFQRDFFSSLLKMFNLYVVEDTVKEKHIKIIPFIDFYYLGEDVLLITDDFGTLFDADLQNQLLLEPGTREYLDWSTKLDHSRPIRLRPMSELNGRYFEYKYKQDNDYYSEQYFKKFSEGYGDRIEDTGYEFAREKQTAEVLFANTVLVGYDGEDKVYPTIFKLANNAEDRTEHNIRIMQAKKIEDVASYAVKDGSSTTLTNLTDYGYGGHLDDPDAPQVDLCFGAPRELQFEVTVSYPSANLFNGFWSEYVAEITDKDSKLLIAYFKLNEMDIYNLDFSRLIYVDGALWRLNKVEDYNPMVSDVTKVELLKVIELSYA